MNLYNVVQSWKTTISGLVAGWAIYASQPVHDWKHTLAAATVALIGILAQDLDIIK